MPDPNSAAPGTAGITSRKGGKHQKPNPTPLRTVICKDTWAACRLFHKEMAPCGWDETLAEDNSSQDQKLCQTQRGLPELFSEPLLKPLVYIKNANRSARMNHPGASQNTRILWRKQNSSSHQAALAMQRGTLPAQQGEWFNSRETPRVNRKCGNSHSQHPQVSKVCRIRIPPKQNMEG